MGNDTVFVVLDCLSKYAHFIPFNHPFTAKSVAAAFVREIVWLHGFPRSIICNRDKVFLSHFCTELFWLQGTKLRRITAYHPQTDGQTEIMNKRYLRCFCSESPRTWGQWLPWAEYWYNTTFHSALGTTPFQEVYGRTPPPSFVMEVRKPRMLPLINNWLNMMQPCLPRMTTYCRLIIR